MTGPKFLYPNTIILGNRAIKKWLAFIELDSPEVKLLLRVLQDNGEM
jgi:hypothetical protein